MLSCLYVSVVFQISHGADIRRISWRRYHLLQEGLLECSKFCLYTSRFSGLARVSRVFRVLNKLTWRVHVILSAGLNNYIIVIYTHCSLSLIDVWFLIWCRRWNTFAVPRGGTLMLRPQLHRQARPRRQRAKKCGTSKKRTSAPHCSHLSWPSFLTRKPRSGFGDCSQTWHGPCVQTTRRQTAGTADLWESKCIYNSGVVRGGTKGAGGLLLKISRKSKTLFSFLWTYYGKMFTEH